MKGFNQIPFARKRVNLELLPTYNNNESSKADGNPKFVMSQQTVEDMTKRGKK